MISSARVVVVDARLFRCQDVFELPERTGEPALRRSPSAVVGQRPASPGRCSRARPTGRLRRDDAPWPARTRSAFVGRAAGCTVAGRQAAIDTFENATPAADELVVGAECRECQFSCSASGFPGGTRPRSRKYQGQTAASSCSRTVVRFARLSEDAVCRCGVRYPLLSTCSARNPPRPGVAAALHEGITASSSAKYRSPARLDSSARPACAAQVARLPPARSWPRWCRRLSVYDWSAR